jgi:hypothetical protein
MMSTHVTPNRQDALAFIRRIYFLITLLMIECIQMTNKIRGIFEYISDTYKGICMSRYFMPWGQYAHNISHKRPLISIRLLVIKETYFLCRQKSPTRCYTVIYGTCNMLNMFRALLCPSSGARDYTEGCTMWHMSRATSLIPDAQPATPRQNNGQPAQGDMCHML